MLSLMCMGEKISDLQLESPIRSCEVKEGAGGQTVVCFKRLTELGCYPCKASKGFSGLSSFEDKLRDDLSCIVC